MIRIKTKILILFLFITIAFSEKPNTEIAITEIFNSCFKCHGGDWATEAGIDFTNLEKNKELDVWEYRNIYSRALNMISQNKMPPPEEEPLKNEARSQLISWLSFTLDNVDINKIPNDPGYLIPSRLTKHQYDFSIKDIFGINDLPENLLPDELVVEDAFDNDITTLSTEPLWFEQSLNAANIVINKVWSNKEAYEKLIFVKPSLPYKPEKALFVASSSESKTINLNDNFSIFTKINGNSGRVFLKSTHLDGFLRRSKQLSFDENSISYLIQGNKRLEVDNLEIDKNKTNIIGLNVVNGQASIFLNGKFLISANNFKKSDDNNHLFKIGKGRSKRVYEELPRNFPPFEEIDILCTKIINNGKDCTNDGIIDMVEFEDLVGSREETFDKYFFAIVDFGKTIGIDHSYDENTPDKDRFITKELYLAAQKASNERVDIYPGVKELKYFSKPHTFEEMQLLTEASNFDDLNNFNFNWNQNIKTIHPEYISAENAAGQVLESFLTKVFRRDPTEVELNRYLKLFKDNFNKNIPYDIAIQIPIKAALCSPSFLLRNEQIDEDNFDIYSVENIDLASRLSFFIWSSIPDEELLNSAKNGNLNSEDELIRQTDRMLNDPKAHRFFERFIVQWLRTEGLGDTYNPDSDRFPEITKNKLNAMKKEGVYVFEDVIKNNKSLFKLLDDDGTYMNKDLAEHYGYENDLNGEDWQRVIFKNNRNRGGLLSQAAVLTVSSSPRRTSPVFRGKWILDVVIGEPPPPPPPNVPALGSEQNGSTAKTLREMLAAHREDIVCAGCHDNIDPYGLALEQFDAVGRVRVEKQNTLTTLPNGQNIDGYSELRKFIIDEKGDEFIRHLTSRLLSYAISRDLHLSDERSIVKILNYLEENNFESKKLIHQIVLSEPFRFRKNPIN